MMIMKRSYREHNALSIKNATAMLSANIGIHYFYEMLDTEIFITCWSDIMSHASSSTRGDTLRASENRLMMSVV